MSENTKIEWADHTFNPWIGCTKVGPGCDNCYAEAWDRRFSGGESLRWGPHAARTRTSDANWLQPLRWNAQAERERRRFRVFCASLADWLDPAAPIEWLVALLDLIRRTPYLDWLLLTKRIGNLTKRLWQAVDAAPTVELRDWIARWAVGDPPAHVSVGATMANQPEVDRDIGKLIAAPARRRFISLEPMLGPIDLAPALARCDHGSTPGPGGAGGVTCSECSGNGHGCTHLHWVIVGGESGPGARPFDVSWARALVEQCTAAGVPIFVKQLGAQPRGWCASRVHVDPADAADHEDDYCDLYEAHESSSSCRGRCVMFTDRKGADMAEWPIELRRRQFPRKA